MFKKILLVLLLTVALVFTGLQAASASFGTHYYEDLEYIICFNDGMTMSQKEKICTDFYEQVGAEVLDSFSIINADLVKINKKEDLDTLKTLFAPFIKTIEPNHKVTKTVPISEDYFAAELWGLKNYGQPIDGTKGAVPGVDINLEKAWEIAGELQEVKIAVIDTGIDYRHPDLEEKIAGGINFYNEGDDFFKGTEDNHGTHVAGTIAANKDTIGVVGAAPNAKIESIKFLGGPGGSGTIGGAIKAIEYVYNKNILIANCSWGGSNYSEALKMAIKNSGILFIVSAGNSGTLWGAPPSYPAAYDLPNILSVAAIDRFGELAYYSSYDPELVHVAAPGSAVLSTITNNKYAYYNGTSMSAPHVTGVATLLAGKGIVEPVEIKEIIIESARQNKYDSLKGKIYSEGVVDAHKALLLAGAAPGPDPEPDPELITGTVEIFHISKTGTVLEHEKKAFEFEDIKVVLVSSKEIPGYKLVNGQQDPQTAILNKEKRETEVYFAYEQSSNNNADLRALSITPGVLTPDFSPEVLSYSSEVEYDVNLIGINITRSDARARVYINDQEISRQSSVSLNDPGKKTKVVIKVISEDNSATKLYTLDIYRKQKPAAPNPDPEPKLPANPPVNNSPVASISVREGSIPLTDGGPFDIKTIIDVQPASAMSSISYFILDTGQEIRGNVSSDGIYTSPADFEAFVSETIRIDAPGQKPVFLQFYKYKERYVELLSYQVAEKRDRLYPSSFMMSIGQRATYAAVPKPLDATTDFYFWLSDPNKGRIISQNGREVVVEWLDYAPIHLGGVFVYAQPTDYPYFKTKSLRVVVY